MTIIVTGLNEITADLNAAPLRAQLGARAVVEKGALNIKNSWRSTWSGLSHAPSLGAAVTYDINVTSHGVEAEIGPDKSLPQGALGNLLEYGSRNNAPIPGGGPALDRELPGFAEAMEKLAERAL